MYDHSNKIGNKGDLIKHLALTVAVREMVNGKESFSYLDVHSGRSQYALPESGEWISGVGRFSEICRTNARLPEDLKYFCHVQSIADIHKSRRYPGSSRVVSNVLLDRNVQHISMMLCDLNIEVCQDLEAEYQGEAGVEIYNADGYQKALEATCIDLIFIDPPDISGHYAPYLKLIKQCAANSIDFISWNPLHGNSVAQTQARNCLYIAEFADKQEIPYVTVRWTDGWSGQMCGCQMLFSVPGGHKVVDSCDKLTDLMGWARINSSSIQGS